jgi:hypothetical protein
MPMVTPRSRRANVRVFDMPRHAAPRRLRVPARARRVYASAVL